MIAIGILGCLMKNGISDYKTDCSCVPSKLSNMRIKFTTLTLQALFQLLNLAVATLTLTSLKKCTFSIVLSGLFVEKYLGLWSSAISLQMSLFNIFLPFFLL